VSQEFRSVFHRRVFWACCSVLALLFAASIRLVADRAPAQSSSAAAVPQGPVPAPVSSAAPALPDQALIQKYCATCHNDRAKTGGISFDGINVAEAGKHSEIFEKALVKLRGGMMPPQGMPRPDETTMNTFIVALENTLDAQARQSPDPGFKPVHRLNRTEYGNAVRDILDLNVDVADLLPADDESYGFDNIAGVLRVSPSLLEQYLTAAHKISSLAVGTDTDLIRADYRIPPDDSQKDHVEGLPLGTRGGLLVRHTFPLDAEYEFSVSGAGPGGGGAGGTTIDVTLDGEQLKAPNVRT
jgi:cytochrome c551/c552